MRNILTLIFFSFCIINFVTAQYYSRMGDEAMNNGEYQRAIDYYSKAYDQNPSDDLTKKINLAQSLKKEFEDIDKAISAQNFAEAEVHINNVLMIDPSNKFIEEKRQQIKQKQSQNSRAQRQKNWRHFTYVFKGDDAVHRRFGGFHISAGYSKINEKFYKPFFGIDTLMPISKNNNGYNINLYYNNSQKIPLTLEFGFTMNDAFLNGLRNGGYSQFKVSFHKLHFGLSYSIRPIKMLNFDIGGGYNIGNFNTYTCSTSTPTGSAPKELYRDKYSFSEPYYKLGLTIMFNNKYGGGLSYHYSSNFNPENKMSFHSVSYIFGKKPSLWILGLGLLLGLAAISISIS
ncbi:MAG: tetratricopeptide repeat protein [Flavobacteriales bacterium]|nr:tetratricopeptide repeat protein [Flavobacteriales bacterium]MDW8433041.1 tetratricopeptide repeat protein [Flavobacteriales bacterium]